MELEIIMLSEINRKRKTNSTCSLSCVKSRIEMNDRNVRQGLFGGGYKEKGEG
jgi:hypothetical protein